MGESGVVQPRGVRLREADRQSWPVPLWTRTPRSSTGHCRRTSGDSCPASAARRDWASPCCRSSLRSEVLYAVRPVSPGPVRVAGRGGRVGRPAGTGSRIRFGRLRVAVSFGSAGEPGMPASRTTELVGTGGRSRQLVLEELPVLSLRTLNVLAGPASTLNSRPWGCLGRQDEGPGGHWPPSPSYTGRGDGGNRTRVQRCGTRASPCAVRCDFLGPGDHADKSPTGSVTVGCSSGPRDRV